MKNGMTEQQTANKIRPEQLDRYGTQIAARMNSEGARDWSDSEIERCLAGCVSGHKLIPLAKQMRANGMTGQVTPEPYTDDPSVTAFDLAHGDKLTASKAVAAVQPLKPALDDCPCERAGDWRLIEASDHLEIQDAETHDLICTVDLDDTEIFDSDTNDPAKENARLIASAPRLKRERAELLSVLNDALALANRLSLTRQKWSMADQHVYERMESAIARAEKGAS